MNVDSRQLPMVAGIASKRHTPKLVEKRLLDTFVLRAAIMCVSDGNNVMLSEALITDTGS